MASYVAIVALVRWCAGAIDKARSHLVPDCMYNAPDSGKSILFLLRENRR